MASNHSNTNNPIQNAIHNALHGIQTVTPPNLSSLYPDSDEDEEGESSAIHICIETPLNIRGHNNLVAVNPSEIAQQISISMVSALRTLCEGSTIPMVDENGIVRPIKFEVKAEVNVTGSRNVVGETAVLEAVVEGKIPKPKATGEDFVDAKEGLDMDENGKAKSGEERMGIRTKVSEEAVSTLGEVQAAGLAKGEANCQISGHELKERRKRALSPPTPVDDDLDVLFPFPANTKRARLQ